MIKNFFKKITGIQAIETAKLQAEAEAEVARKLAEQKLKEAADAEAKLEESKLTPKEKATKRKEPWVAVLDTHVNKENVRNGFFELDWNEYFIVQLREAGFGYEGDPDEVIVDLWFKELCRGMFAEEGIDENRGAGYINVVPISRDKSEVS